MPPTRRNAYGFVSATLAAVTLFGCGPRDAGTQGTGGASPVTLEVKSRPTAVGGAKVNYVAMDFDKFYDSWKENPAAAESRCNGNPDGIRFTGKVVEITINKSNQTVAILTAPNAVDKSRYVVVAVLTDLAGEGLRKCKVGGIADVKAVGAGITPADPAIVAHSIDPAK